MTDVNLLITDHLDIWTAAIEKKSSAGRGNGGSVSLHGIKKLRELILELAVRGKLVAQDSEETYFQLSQEKKTKAQQKFELAEISPDEEPFERPRNWQFVRFIDVLDFSGGGQPPKSAFSPTPKLGYVQLIQIRDLGPNPQPVFVPEEKVSKFCTEKDVMIGRYGASVGKVFWGKNGAYNVALIKLIDEQGAYDPSFLHLLMSSPAGQALFLGISRSAQDGFNKGDIAPRVLPVPPLAEQHRIVAKVDELMALCDALERQAEDSIKAHQTLVETCLATLTNSQSPEDLTQNWTRIEAHFDTLFTTEESVEALRKVILDLGAMGRLTSPSQGEVKASEILDLVAKEKGRLVALGQTRREKPLERLDRSKVPFQIPADWLWTKIGDVALFTQYGTSQKTSNLSEGVPVLAMGNIQAGAVSLESDKLLPRSWEEFPALLLQPGDLLYNRTNSAELVGKTGIFDGPEDSFTFASYLIRIRVDHSLVRPRYLNFVMNSPYFRATQIVPKIKKQTGQANVNGTFLKNMLVPLPPTEDQDAIIDRIENLSKVCGRLGTGLRQLGALQRVIADTLTSKIH